MNIDTQDKTEINNYSHKRNGSKASLIEVTENDYNIYSHNRTGSKSNLTGNTKFTHNRSSSKSSITNILGKRIGTFSRTVKINDRGSSLPRNVDAHTHKQSFNNLRTNASNDFLIQTRESSLFYNNNNSNNNSTTNSVISSNVPYSSHSRENLNYLYHYTKLSPTSSPRDVNVQSNSPLSSMKNVMSESTPPMLTPSHFTKSSNLANHYSPTSATSVSPKYPRENYYQKESYNKYNFHTPAASKEIILKSALRNKKMKQWSVNDVLVWLTENNLEKYKETFKNMKMDGKTLMKQNYETLIDISILDKVKIISLRNSVLQFEKEGEMTLNNNNSNSNNNNNNNNSVAISNQIPQYTQTLQRHEKLYASPREVDVLKDEVFHNLTKSRSFESLTTNNKENENKTPTSENMIFTLPRKITPVSQSNILHPVRTRSVDDNDDAVAKISTLSRTTSLKKKKLIKDDSLNQTPVITPRSSSRNIEMNRVRRKHEYVKTPTTPGSKSTTPLKDKHFLFNFANSPNSAKEPTFEMTSNYIQSPIKSADTKGYDDLLKEELKMDNNSNISPLLRGAKSLNNLNSPSAINPKFLIRISNTSKTQSHTVDITNYTSETKLWERILSKFDIRSSKDNFENYSIALVTNGQNVPLTTADLLNMIKVNESMTMVELVLISKIKPMEITRPIIKNKNIHNITDTINRSISNSSSIKLTTVPPKDKHSLLNNIKPEIRKSERLKKFFGERPPSMLICDQLEQYFPEVNKNKNKSEKIKSIVLENIKVKRLSRLSRLSQSHLSYSSYDDQSILGNVSEDFEYETDGQFHDENMSPEAPKKISIGDKRNSRKLSIITSPDKLKELKTNRNKNAFEDIESEVEMNISSEITNEGESEITNEDIYTNEITDYSFSSELSSEAKTSEDLNNTNSRVSMNTSSSFNEHLNNLINYNKKSSDGNGDEDEEDDDIDHVGRSKRRGQYINKGTDTAIKRNTRSFLGNIERIYNMNNTKESTESESESNQEKQDTVSSSEQSDPSKSSLGESVVVPRPSISEARRNRRAFKGISVVSVGRKSIYSMNLKSKLMPQETRFSIMVPQKPIQWTRGPLIGQGSFSKVYHGLNIETGEIMAVKQVELCLPMSQENDEESKKKNKQMLDALHHEIKLLKDLNHENIVRYLGFELTETSSNVFLEYVSGGSVSSLIAKIGKFEEPLVKSLTSQIAAGMEYLHNRSIIHRDIKGANILVDEDGIAKISDFGISKKNEYEMAYKYNSRMSFQGSIFWMAPEVIRGKGYSAKVDIWSLGCVVLEMFTGVHPWKQFDEIQTVMYNLGMMNKPYIPKRLSQESQNLLNMCLDVNPEKRPTAKQLLAHSFCKPPEVPFDFKEYYQQAIEKVNKFDISTISNSVTSVTSNSVTSYDITTEISNEEIITEESSTREPTTENDMILEDVEEEEEEEEEEELVNLDNIIPKELKLDTLNESDPNSDEETDPELLPTPRNVHPSNKSDRSSPTSDSTNNNNLLENSLDLATPVATTSKDKIENIGEDSSREVKRMSQISHSHTDINNSKSISNGTSTLSSFTFSLSLTNSSFSSISTSLSSLSSSFETGSSDINSMSNKPSTSLSSSSEPTEEESEGHPSLMINTNYKGSNKLNGSNDHGMTRKFSNMSLSRISEESPSQLNSSPVLLTPRTPGTPTTPKQNN